jgi:DNA-binding NarL/FixJ family response regulator
MAQLGQSKLLRKSRTAYKSESDRGAAAVSKPRGSPPGPTITMVLVAGSAGWDGAVRRCAEAAEDLLVVGEASDARSAVDLVKRHRPAVVLVDQKFWRRRRPFSVASLLRHAHRGTRILAVTSRTDDAFALQVIRDGGHGVMVEEALARQLPKAVRCLVAGQAWLSRAQEARVLAALLRMRQGGRGASAGLGGRRRRS